MLFTSVRSLFWLGQLWDQSINIGGINILSYKDNKFGGSYTMKQ